MAGVNDDPRVFQAYCALLVSYRTDSPVSLVGTMTSKAKLARQCVAIFDDVMAQSPSDAPQESAPPQSK